MRMSVCLLIAGSIHSIPFTVDADGYFTKEAPGFEGKRVIDDKGNFGDANEAVIKALIKANALIARGRLRHDYPHSWRSKKPVIFRNTPQWFIAMDDDIDGGDTLRNARALKAIGRNALGATARREPHHRHGRDASPIGSCRASAPGACPSPCSATRRPARSSPARDFNASGELIDRVVDAFRKEGADAWFEEGAEERFLAGLVDNPRRLGEGRRHSRRLVRIQARPTLSCSRSAPTSLGQPRSISKARTSIAAGSSPRFWSRVVRAAVRLSKPCSPMASSSTRTAARCRSRSGNVVAPQDVIRQSGAEILRLWAMSSDYAEDLRIGPDIIKANVESYRKLRNTLRFLLGNLAHYEPSLAVRLQRDAGA